MIRCPNCGTDNKPSAKFCKVCGKPLPTLQPPTSPPSSLPVTRQPTALPQRQPQLPPQVSRQYPVPRQPTAQSIQTAPPRMPTAQPLSTRLQTAINPTTNLYGVVMDDPQERRDFPPRDWSKALFIIAILILVLPPVAMALSVAGLLVCALTLLGMGAIFSCILIPLSFFIGLAGIFRGPQRAEVPIYEFRVQDQSGSVANVEIIGKRRGGRIARGDEIEAWGAWSDSGHTALRAWRVQIHRVASLGGAQAGGGIVSADRPRPKAWGVTALGVSLVVAVILYGVPLLQMLGFKF